MRKKRRSMDKKLAKLRDLGSVRDLRFRVVLKSSQKTYGIPFALISL